MIEQEFVKDSDFHEYCDVEFYEGTLSLRFEDGHYTWLYYL